MCPYMELIAINDDVGAGLVPALMQGNYKGCPYKFLMTDKIIEEQLDIIRRGTVEIISEAELVKKIERSLRTEKPLVIKAGFDPTAPDLHLGHCVLLRKLRHFQSFGHKIVFLVGDFTALIGDPSGQNKTRPIMTHEQIETNAKTYLQQVSKILNVEDEKHFQVVRNSQWFGTGNIQNLHFTLEQTLIELASKYTIAQLLQRDDFAKRFKEDRPITISELFYPLMQGHDSVALRADVEIGGTDQKFNLLVGREFQKTSTPPQEPQVVITMPLLEGTDGVNKMSKSLGNAIGIQEDPKEMFGKIMSISDDLMLRYYELLTEEDVNKIKAAIQSGKNPKEAKEELAFRITKDFHGQDRAQKALVEFRKIFQKGEIPEEMSVLHIQPDQEGKLDLLKFLVDQQVIPSMSEARRLLNQGSIRLNRAGKIQDRYVTLKDEDILQIGPRKFIRLKT